MYRTMRGLLATLVMLLGALAMTGLLASSLQNKATADHHVDEGFLPGDEALTDRFGWRIEPKAVRSDDAAADKERSRPSPESDDGL